jgi:hypothetical protein
MSVSGRKKRVSRARHYHWTTSNLSPDLPDPTRGTDTMLRKTLGAARCLELPSTMMSIIFSEPLSPTSRLAIPNLEAIPFFPHMPVVPLMSLEITYIASLRIDFG